MRTKTALLCILMLAILTAASGCVVNKANTAEENVSEAIKENPWKTPDYNDRNAVVVQQVILDHKYEFLWYAIEIKKPDGKNEILEIEKTNVEIIRGNYSEARLVVSMRGGPMTEQRYVLYTPEDMPIY